MHNYADYYTERLEELKDEYQDHLAHNDYCTFEEFLGFLDPGELMDEDEWIDYQVSLAEDADERRRESYLNSRCGTWGGGY